MLKRPKPIKHATLEALLDADTYLVQMDLAPALGATLSAFSEGLYALEITQNRGICVPNHLKPIDVERCFFKYENLLQWQKESIFLIKSLKVM